MTDFNPDEFRPNAPAPQFRRALRLDVERDGATIALSVEDPSSAAEVTEFFAVVRTVLAGNDQPCGDLAPRLGTGTFVPEFCAGPLGHAGEHSSAWPPVPMSTRWSYR